MDFDGRFEKKEFIEIECPECGEVNAFEDDETILEDTLVCNECECEFHLAQEEESDDLDSYIPDTEVVVGDCFSFILEHCESNTHLKETLTELYNTAFCYGMKQAFLVQLDSMVESMNIVNDTIEKLSKYQEG